MSDYTREQLIEICLSAIVPQEDWSDRDSASAQQKVGQCFALLKSGCDYAILTEGSLTTTEETIWLEIEFRGFDWFDSYFCDESEEAYLERKTFYLPTLEKLEQANGKDWY